MRTICAVILAFLFCAASLGLADGAASPPAHGRGKKSGDYSLKLVGQYSGKGKSAILLNFVTITADIKAPNGATGTVTFNMPLVNDRFQGTTTFNGVPLTISGRIDMPANTDAQQTPAQKITGRISALLTDPSGKAGRLVAIEDESSRALITYP